MKGFCYGLTHNDENVAYNNEMDNNDNDNNDNNFYKIIIKTLLKTHRKLHKYFLPLKPIKVFQ